MTTQLASGLLFVAGTVVLGAIFVWVGRSPRRGEVPYEQVSPRGSPIRRYGMVVLGVAALLAFAFSLPRLPYTAQREARLGGEPVPVQVQATQWQFTIEPAQVPVNQPIRFEVTSDDVNHSFAIIDPGGDIVGQVQAMPGYTNVLVLDFDEVGSYTIRCFEYCGLGHTAMVFPDFEVVP